MTTRIGRYAPLTLAIGPDEAVQFTSNDLEFGNANAGLTGSTGPGYGSWWLKLSSELDLEVLSYVRSADGFLTSMHDTAPNDGTQHSIATFGPGSDVNQTSLLRMVNPGEAAATAVIIGVDDQGRSPGTQVRVTVPPRSSKTLSATELESGGGDLEGALGDGTGSWQLSVESEMPLIVTSLLATRTGYLTNLSTLPAHDGELETQNPDLQVSGVAVAGMAHGIQPGSALTLSLVVQNVGDVESAATTVRYYQSNNATISTLDTEVENDAVDALEPSGSSEKSALLTAPSSPGTYYYGACIDAVAGESETVDNCSASVQMIVEDSEQHPDLEIGPPSVSESAPVAGAEFTLSATVRNTGDGDASATTVRYYRSTNPTISTLDTEVASDAVEELPAAANSAELATLIAPEDAGTYYYGVCVDPVTGESDASNNCSASVAVQVHDSDRNPDLEVGPPSVSDTTPAAGTEFRLSATVRNTGDGASDATTLRYFRSPNSTISRFNREVGTDEVQTLAASGRSPELITLMAPSSAGTYYFGACVDTVTGESDTTDNCSASVEVEVEVEAAQQQPNLEVDSPSVGNGSPNTGSDSTVPATVRNTGDGTCVDAVSGESFTNNNCSAAVPVTLSEPQGPSQGYPDLVVASPSVSGSNRTPGANFTVTVMVLNIGDGPSSSTTLGYYRSTDATITTSDTFVGANGVRALAVAGISRQPNSLAAPASPGTYYYGACVEPVSGESATNNNCSAAVPVTVSESQEGGQPETEVHLFTPESVEEHDGNEAIAVVAWTTGDRPPTVSIRVRVWVVAGTAEEGVDFGRFSQSVEFNAEDFTLKGSTYEAIEILSITILDDTEAEGDETFGATMTLERARPFVTLSPNYPDQLRVIIRANDDAG